MSLVNLTLGVQAINFFLAYLILKYFLLKPAIMAIQSEDTLQQHLIAKVHQSHKRISDKQREIQEKWQECQKEFADNAPLLEVNQFVTRSTTKALSLAPINEQEVMHKAQEIEHELIKKVAHVRH
ncbi:MAG: hypothetical protein ACOYT8_02500 [Candidatus Dependentiae bacterium]